MYVLNGNCSNIFLLLINYFYLYCFIIKNYEEYHIICLSTSIFAFVNANEAYSDTHMKNWFYRHRTPCPQITLSSLRSDKGEIVENTCWLILR